MFNFTRFENQYIMMLAIRAKQDLEKEFKSQDDYSGSNIETYVKALQEIAIKAKSNCQEYDRNKE